MTGKAPQIRQNLPIELKHPLHSGHLREEHSSSLGDEKYFLNNL
jgi:hypothetical protein